MIEISFLWLIAITLFVFWLGTAFATAVLTYAALTEKGGVSEVLETFRYYWETKGLSKPKWARMGTTVLLWIFCPLILWMAWIIFLYKSHQAKKEEAKKKMADSAKSRVSQTAYTVWSGHTLVNTEDLEYIRDLRLRK